MKGELLFAMGMGFGILVIFTFLGDFIFGVFVMLLFLALGIVFGGLDLLVEKIKKVKLDTYHESKDDNNVGEKR